MEIGKPFGDPGEMSGLLGRGDRTGLERRLIKDVKALYAYYWYGVRHNYVRLRWGFLDERLGVNWALDGDLSLWPLLAEAAESGAFVDIVTGRAPGWRNPWSRAVRVTVAMSRRGSCQFHGPDGPVHAPLKDIQVARRAPDDGQPS